MRKQFNDLMKKIPYVGDALTTEIKSKHLITAGMAALGIGSAVPAQAGGSIDTLVGSKSTVLDVKSYGDVIGDLDFFARFTDNLSYKGGMGTFGLANLSYPLVGSLLGVLETQFIPGYGTVPRAGVKNFSSNGSWSLFGLATVSVEDELTVEGLVEVGYSGKHITGNIEYIADFMKDGKPLFSILRARVGYNVNVDLVVGAGVDITSLDGTNTANELEFNAGAHVKINY